MRKHDPDIGAIALRNGGAWYFEARTERKSIGALDLGRIAILARWLQIIDIDRVVLKLTREAGSGYGLRVKRSVSSVDERNGKSMRTVYSFPRQRQEVVLV